jgi:hypothetical protein
MLSVASLAVVLIALLGLAYTWLACSACRRWRPAALVGLWLVAALAFAGWGGLYAAAKAARVKPAHASDLGWQAFGLCLVVGLAAFGGATLSVRQRAHEGKLDRRVRLAVRALVAFFAGLGLSLMPAILLDLSR